MFENASRLIRQLASDEQAAIDAASYVLMATIIGIGIVAGLAVVRDSAVQQLGDVAAAMETIDQSYTVTMEFATFEPGVTILQEFEFVDDTGPGDPAGLAPYGIEVCLPATPE